MASVSRMDERPEGHRQFWWAVVAVLASAHFAITTVANHRQFLDLARYAHGLETTPYQYRVLIAWLIRPLGESGAVARLAHIFPGALKEPYALLSCGFDFVAMLGAVFAVRRTLRILFGDVAFCSWASLVTVYMAYFEFSLSYGLNYVLPYDVPNLFFFGLAFLAIVSRNIPLYYLAFVVGTFDRESTILLLVPFAVWGLYDEGGARLERGWARTLPHLVAQGLLWLGAKALILAMFAHRTPLPDDSGLFETHLMKNAISLVKPYQWPLLASVLGFTLPFVFTYRTRIEDARLRKSLEIMVPLWAVAMFVVANLVEIRVFGELIVPMTLGVAAILYRTLRSRGESDATVVASP